MTTEADRPYHPASMLFPLLDGPEFDAFQKDIADNGQLEPIWLHPDGSILDGRNRHRACVALGLVPEFRQWQDNGSPITFVVSMNLHRRHLTSSQRAAMAPDIMPELQAEAKRRQGMRTDIVEIIPQCEMGKSRDQAAKVLHTNPRYVSDAMKLADEAPELFEQVRGGSLSIPGAMAVHYSSETPEWYTPTRIIERTIATMGAIDLDPCSNSGEPNVPAIQHFTEDDDGLSVPWMGRVYMNPPYGREIGNWTSYLKSQYENGNVSEAIALVPARTDTQWFRELRPYVRCFIWGRLRFSEQQTGAPFPSMAVYLGYRPESFVSAFEDIGDIYRWTDDGL